MLIEIRDGAEGELVYFRSWCGWKMYIMYYVREILRQIHVHVNFCIATLDIIVDFEKFSASFFCPLNIKYRTLHILRDFYTTKCNNNNLAILYFSYFFFFLIYPLSRFVFLPFTFIYLCRNTSLRFCSVYV